MIHGEEDYYPLIHIDCTQSKFQTMTYNSTAFHYPSPLLISTCAICFEDQPSSLFPQLPCCGTSNFTSTTIFCHDCLWCLSIPTSHSDPTRLCHCPRCREWISLKPNKCIEKVQESIGTCLRCCQTRLLLISYKYNENYIGICDACYLGSSYSLMYDCKSCQHEQKIAHPMWRYQTTKNDYGNVSWLCHKCQEFRFWRIVSTEISKIPIGETPESWGKDCILLAREGVLKLKGRKTRRKKRDKFV